MTQLQICKFNQHNQVYISYFLISGQYYGAPSNSKISQPLNKTCSLKYLYHLTTKQKQSSLNEYYAKFVGYYFQRNKVKKTLINEDTLILNYIETFISLLNSLTLCIEIFQISRTSLVHIIRRI